MNQKVSIYLVLVAISLSILTFLSPSVVAADEERNAIEWLNDEDTNDQKADEQQDNQQFEEKSPVAVIGQLIFYTLLIVVMIYGLIKFLAVRQKKLLPNQSIQTIGGTPMGNNKSLQLVKVGGKIYLLGVAEQITLIKEFEDTAEIEMIEKDFAQQSINLSSNLLNALRKSPKISKQNQNFNQLFSQSLNRQKEKQFQLDDEIEGRSKE